MPWKRTDRWSQALAEAWAAFAGALAEPYALVPALAGALDGLSLLVKAETYGAYVAEREGEALTLRLTRAAAGTPQIGPNYAGLVSGPSLPPLPLEVAPAEGVAWEEATGAVTLGVHPRILLRLARRGGRRPTAVEGEALLAYGTLLRPVMSILLAHAGQAEASATQRLTAESQTEALQLALAPERLLSLVARLGAEALGARDGYATLMDAQAPEQRLWEMGRGKELSAALPPRALLGTRPPFRLALWRPPQLPPGVAGLGDRWCAAALARTGGASLAVAYASPDPERRSDQAVLEQLVRQAEATLALTAPAHQAARMYVEVLELVAGMMDAADPHTSDHHRRVAATAGAIARELGLAAAAAAAVEQAGRVHDVGMLTVGLSLPLRDGVLSEEERQVLREHPTVGAALLAGLPPSVMPPETVAAVRHHHERWDGHGYPDGRAGEAIPLEGRILAAAEVWVARTTARSYRPALTPGRALFEIERVAGTELDPAVVAALAAHLRRQGITPEPPQP